MADEKHSLWDMFVFILDEKHMTSSTNHHPIIQENWGFKFIWVSISTYKYRETCCLEEVPSFPVGVEP